MKKKEFSGFKVLKFLPSHYTLKLFKKIYLLHNFKFNSCLKASSIPIVVFIHT